MNNQMYIQLSSSKSSRECIKENKSKMKQYETIKDLPLRPIFKISKNKYLKILYLRNMNRKTYNASSKCSKSNWC